MDLPVFDGPYINVAVFSGIPPVPSLERVSSSNPGIPDCILGIIINHHTKVLKVFPELILPHYFQLQLLELLE